MADDEEQGEQEAGGEDEERGERDQFGVPIGELQGVARTGGKALQSLGQKTASTGGKALGTLKGVGKAGLSRIALAIGASGSTAWIAGGLFLLVGLGWWILAIKGTGGSSPAGHSDPADPATRDQVALIACLDTEPSGTADDPTKEDAILLSAECQTLVRREVEAGRALVDDARAQLDSVTQAADKAKAEEVLSKIEQELEAIDTANGKYKPTKEHYDILKKLLEDPALHVVDSKITNKHAALIRQHANADTETCFLGQGSDSGGCHRNSVAVLNALFSWHAKSIETGYGKIERSSTVPPTRAELDQLRSTLRAGNIPVWHVKGDNDNEHWILILSVDRAGKIEFYDPNGGVVRTEAYDHKVAPYGREYAFFGSVDQTSDREYAPDLHYRGYEAVIGGQK